VQIESGPQRIRRTPELVPAAHHEQIRKSIPVRVEELGADVLVETVRGNGRLTGGAQSPIALLDENLPGLPLRSADIEIVETVAIDVSDRQSRAFRRQQG